MNKIEFMVGWHQIQKNQALLQDILQPARAAILQFYCPVHPEKMLWTGFEVVETASGGNVDVDVMIFGDYFVGLGRTDAETYHIPLDIALHGKEAIIAFFTKQEQDKIAKAEYAGKLRYERERESRQRLYEVLKNEFEEVPGTAITVADPHVVSIEVSDESKTSEVSESS